MPRPVLLLCLIAALAGPLLYQAEAADDLARWMTRTASGRVDLDRVDGGVGDEPYLASATKVDADLGAIAAPGLVPGFLDPPLAAAFLLSRDAPDPPREYAPFDPVSGSPRRHAWLQLFRF